MPQRRKNKGPTMKKRPLPSPTNVVHVDEEQIAAVAYELFERRGRIHGHDVQDWMMAKEILLSRARGQISTTSAAAPPPL